VELDALPEGADLEATDLARAKAGNHCAPAIEAGCGEARSRSRRSRKGCELPLPPPPAPGRHGWVFFHPAANARELASGARTDGSPPPAPALRPQAAGRRCPAGVIGRWWLSQCIRASRPTATAGETSKDRRLRVPNTARVGVGRGVIESPPLRDIDFVDYHHIGGFEQGRVIEAVYLPLP